MSDINGLKNTIMTLFDTHQTKKLRKPLASFLRDPLNSYEQKLELLGELTLKDSEYFMEAIYPGTHYQFGSTTTRGAIKRDEHMLKKYCFLEGEEIKTVFIGSIMDKKTATSGRIFLTNFRILVCGNQTTRSAQKKVQVGKPSLTGMLIRSGITHHRKAIRKAITKAFRKDLKEWNLGEWGYYFPIYNAKNMKRGKNAVSYNIDVETEKKTITLKIQVTPSRLKRQTKEEFQEHKDTVLNQVEDLLKQYQ